MSLGSNRIAFIEQRKYTREIYNLKLNQYQSTNEREWFSDSCSAVARGFIDMGYNIVGFLPEEIEKIGITKNTPVRGCVRTTRKIFDYLKVSQPKNIDVPFSIRKFAKRKIRQGTLKELLPLLKKQKTLHVKPLHFQKAFKGQILHSGYSSTEIDFLVKNFGLNFPVLISDYLPMYHETRFFALNGKIISEKECHDRSWVDWFENKKFAQQVIDAYKDQPASFAIDIATAKIDNKHENVVVEVNDGFSCGFIGDDITDLQCAEITLARWEEIVKK